MQCNVASPAELVCPREFSPSSRVAARCLSLSSLSLKSSESVLASSAAAAVAGSVAVVRRRAGSRRQKWRTPTYLLQSVVSPSNQYNNEPAQR